MIVVSHEEATTHWLYTNDEQVEKMMENIESAKKKHREDDAKLLLESDPLKSEVSECSTLFAVHNNLKELILTHCALIQQF